jgi:hypothetical protein
MVGGLFYVIERDEMTKTKDETPDYVAIYDDASFDCPIPEYAHAAGIAAVAAAAKAEAAFTATEFLVDVVRGVEAERDAAYRLITNLKLTAAEDLVYVRRIEAERDAAAHTTDLREQSKFYAVKAMPDGVGE